MPVSQVDVMTAVRQRLEDLATQMSWFEYALTQPVPPMLICRAALAADRAASEFEQLAGVIKAALDQRREKGGAA